MDQNLPSDSYENMPKRGMGVKILKKMSTSFMDEPSAYAQGYLRKLLTSDITRTLRLVGGKVFFLLAYLLFKRGFSFAYAQCLKMD